MQTSARHLSVVLIAITLAACSDSPSAPAAAKPTTFVVRGVVRNALFGQMRDGVADASVSLTYAGASSPELSTKTGADGSFQIAGVAAGKGAQIVVSKSGYFQTKRDVLPLTADVTVEVGIAIITFTLAGGVLDAADGAPVPGAQVEIVAGSRHGTTVLTDATGRFDFGQVSGDVSISVSRINYESRTVPVEAAANASIEVRLASQQRLGRVMFAGDLCTKVPIPPWLSCSAPKEQRHSFEVKRTGRMIVSTDYRYVGDYYPNSLSLEVRCGSQLVSGPWSLPAGPSKPIEIAVDRACIYDIHLFDFIADTKGGAQTTYRVVVDYPQ